MILDWRAVSGVRRSCVARLWTGKREGHSRSRRECIVLSADRRKCASITEAQMVWVNPYHRVRYGKIESVKGHYRSFPIR
jgi:hypothetical protein